MLLLIHLILFHYFLKLKLIEIHSIALLLVMTGFCASPILQVRGFRLPGSLPEEPLLLFGFSNSSQDNGAPMNYPLPVHKAISLSAGVPLQYRYICAKSCHGKHMTWRHAMYYVPSKFGQPFVLGKHTEDLAPCYVFCHPFPTLLPDQRAAVGTSRFCYPTGSERKIMMSVRVNGLSASLVGKGRDLP